MPKKRWSKEFQDLRGRWVDNPKMVRKIVDDAKQGRDWTERLRPFLAANAERIVPKGHGYSLPPDLRNMCFDHMDLSDAKLRHVCLSSATAYRTEAEKLDCTGSILHRSRWGNSNLLEASFDNVRAARAHFAHCKLGGARFRKSDLRYSSLLDSDLADADFSGADLRFAYLSGAKCEGANFSGAKLYGASLWNLEYEKVKADGIDISPEADGSVITNNIRLAPLISLLAYDRKLAEIVAMLKFNTVVILGKDSTPEGYAILSSIGDIGSQRGLIPILVKDQAEIPGEPFLKKALMYCLLARFVIVENSSAAGQILEFPNALREGCVVAVLQKRGTGSTWLVDEEFIKYRTAKRFWYETEEFEAATCRAFDWCIDKTNELAKAYASLYGILDLKYVPMMNKSTPNDSEDAA